jgi:Uma2 family endonuclease
VGDPAKKRATYEDVLATPRHLVAEVVAGVLHTQPRPAVPHARAASQLGSELGAPFGKGQGGPGGWILLDEPELHLGREPDILVPDLAGWRRERMPRLPMESAFISLAPDWICEVVSPSTQAFDRGEKMDVYARERVRHAWLVDPLAKLLEVWRLEHEKWLRLGSWLGSARVRAEPFEAFELELEALWAE